MFQTALRGKESLTNCGKASGSLEKLSLGSYLGLIPRELPRDSFSRLPPWLLHSLSKFLNAYCDHVY